MPRIAYCRSLNSFHYYNISLTRTNITAFLSTLKNGDKEDSQLLIILRL